MARGSATEIVMPHTAQVQLSVAAGAGAGAAADFSARCSRRCWCFLNAAFAFTYARRHRPPSSGAAFAAAFASVHARLRRRSRCSDLVSFSDIVVTSARELAATWFGLLFTLRLPRSCCCVSSARGVEV